MKATEKVHERSNQKLGLVKWVFSEIEEFAGMVERRRVLLLLKRNVLDAYHSLERFPHSHELSVTPLLTHPKVDEHLDEFNSTRSIGYLCAATADNFEQVLDEILENKKKPVELRRIRTSVNGVPLPFSALNDVMLAHPNPAAVSRCSFSKSDGQSLISEVYHTRSSGIRICTATGSTAAMRSAGGLPMDVLSSDLQYMVREPVLSCGKFKEQLKGWIRPNELMVLQWVSDQGFIYLDGSYVTHALKSGSVVQISSDAPPLKFFAPHRTKFICDDF